MAEASITPETANLVSYQFFLHRSVSLLNNFTQNWVPPTNFLVQYLNRQTTNGNLQPFVIFSSACSHAHSLTQLHTCSHSQSHSPIHTCTRTHTSHLLPLTHHTHILAQMLKTQFFQILKIANFLCSFNRARLPGVTDRGHRRLRPHCPPPDPHHHLRRQGRQVLLLQRLRLESPPQQEGLQEHRH